MQKPRIFHRTVHRALMLAALLAAPMIPSIARAGDEDFGKFDPGEVPALKPASDAGEKAIGKMQIPRGLNVSLWAAEPLLANPVALNFDNLGRCYLVETWRFEHGVIDMRGHADWLDEDLAAKTVEDRIGLVKRKMGPNARTFAKFPDVVRQLTDTTGSGKADKSTEFAEFHALEDGIASGVVTRKNNVYVTNIPNLWLLQDTKNTGKADVKKSLSYGYGIRYNFLGHDLHGPRFGPDGKLYFTIGDRAANIEKSVDGTKVQNTESGSVFRCNADGSALEIFATGLRNPQSLAFDDYGNLFSGDNNPDYGDPARWVYIVEAGDSGWRVGYQYDHNPIGGGPWMNEGLYKEQQNSTASYFLPPVKDMGAGPSGVAYYPGTGLGKEYDHHFFECDFRGGFTGSGVHTFTMEPSGAGFKMGDLHNFVWNTLCTDIVFGPQGGAFITDWVEGWHVTGVGRIYHVTDPEAMKDPIVKEVQTLLADGFEKRPADELVKLLAHRDQRIRLEAQYELADRGEASVSALQQVAQANESQLARIHAIWGLGQIAVKSPKVLDALLPLLADKDAEIRSQAARLLGDHKIAGAYDGLIKQLTDENLRVRYFATAGLSKLGRPEAIEPVLEMIRQNADQDVYLRHAGVMALVRLNSTDAIEKAAKDSSRSVRLVAELAMRRMSNPKIAQFLHDADPQLVLEAARAINDLPIPEAMPELASLIQNVTLPDFVMIRVVNANYRVGTSDSAKALAQFAANTAAPRKWRVAALEDLADWQSPGAHDKVTNFTRPLPDREPQVARDAANPVLASILKDSPNSVIVAGLEVIKKLGVNNSAVLIQLVADQKLGADVRAGAISTMASQNDVRLNDAVTLGMSSPEPEVRAAAITAMPKLPRGVARVTRLIGAGSILEQQAVYAALGSAQGKEADDALAAAMDHMLKKELAPELELDVIDAAAMRQDPRVVEKLKYYQSTLAAASDNLAEYLPTLVGGNAAAGDKIFHNRTDVSCVRCHTIHGAGGIVGPVLDGIGTRKDRRYILESVVYPNAQIAPGFESITLKLKDSRGFIAIVKKETETELDLIDADNHEIKVTKADIVSRQKGQSAMPEGLAKMLSKHDLRDLVQYLAELKN